MDFRSHLTISLDFMNHVHKEVRVHDFVHNFSQNSLERSPQFLDMLSRCLNCAAIKNLKLIGRVPASESLFFFSEFAVWSRNDSSRSFCFYFAFRRILSVTTVIQVFLDVPSDKIYRKRVGRTPDDHQAPDKLLKTSLSSQIGFQRAHA